MGDDNIKPRRIPPRRWSPVAQTAAAAAIGGAVLSGGLARQFLKGLEQEGAAQLYAKADPAVVQGNEVREVGEFSDATMDSIPTDPSRSVDSAQLAENMVYRLKKAIAFYRPASPSPTTAEEERLSEIRTNLQRLIEENHKVGVSVCNLLKPIATDPERISALVRELKKEAESAKAADAQVAAMLTMLAAAIGAVFCGVIGARAGVALEERHASSPARSR